eukprot:Skav205033  [mRNA]  locus=scaffold2669:102881:103692:- [translate_table: standard]
MGRSPLRCPGTFGHQWGDEPSYDPRQGRRRARASLRVLKLVRILRIARIASVFPELHILISSIMAAGHSGGGDGW